jgi:predicted transcriptional regulator of viral defense system
MYSKIIEEIERKGRSSFTIDDIRNEAASSVGAIRIALNRMIKKGKLAKPYKGFYVILPPEHRLKGCLPPEQFIPDLMGRLGVNYYTGLLSAAEYYGAAHQKPQIFQVVSNKTRRPIICGKVHVDFIFRKNASKIPVIEKNTTAGIIKISSPEATAIDLIGYAKKSAGLDNVAGILSELAERIEINRILEIANLSPVSWVQRLGYLFELLGDESKAAALAKYIEKIKPLPVALVPGSGIKGSKLNKKWRLYINAKVEPEL